MKDNKEEVVMMEVGNEINLDDVLMYLSESERELVSGNLLRSHTLSRKARKIMNEAGEQHRKTIKGLRKFIKKMMDMKEIGYNVKEAEAKFEEAVKAASSFRYTLSEKKLSDAWESLNRAEYLPFPLWEKDVMLKTVIYYEEGLVYYKVRVENYENYPLGEILIKPMLPDYFEGIEEINCEIGPKEYHEVTYRLKPNVEEWAVGIDGKLLKENNVMIKTGLQLKKVEGTYQVRLENNSDAILRNVVVVANVPTGLKTDEPEKIIDYIPPFGSETVVFDVKPTPISELKKKEDLVMVKVEDEGDEIEQSKSFFSEEDEWEFEEDNEE